MGIIASKPARLPLSPDFYFGRMGEWKSGNNCDRIEMPDIRLVKKECTPDQQELNLKEDGITHEMHLCLHRQF
ncbi:hypothetical protein [Paenibacillus lautus]|uniref:hypothetical protein n=1 Tax=Paenibacillus lautus TaxID=1401 RepID=UPI0039868C94